MERRTITSVIRLIVATAMMMAGLTAAAQNSFTVSMKLTDAKTDAPVGFATASVTVKGEKTPAKYVLADSEGKAVLQKVRK